MVGHPFLQFDDAMEDDDEEEEEEDFAEIELSNIMFSGRRRATAQVDYSSEEALKKAGLSNEAEATADAEEEDPEFQVSSPPRRQSSLTLNADLA